MGTGSQREFDFNRASQLSALRDAVLPGVPQVSAAAMKAALRAIDDFARTDGECFATAETLAVTAGVGLRTVKRALAALESLSLVTCERRKSRYGTTTNHYRIVWSELALLNGRRPSDQRAMVARAECHGGTLQRAMVSNQRAMVSDQRAMVALAECHGGTQTVLGINRPQPPRETAEVVAAAASVGVLEENATAAVTTAMARGVTLVELLALVDHYRANASSWRGPGALVAAFRAVRPGQSADAAFPPGDGSVAKAAEVERTRTTNRRELARAIAFDCQRAGLGIDETIRRLTEAGLSVDDVRCPVTD